MIVTSSALSLVLAVAAGTVPAAPVAYRAAPADSDGAQQNVVLLAGVVASGGGRVTEAPSRTGSGGPAMRFPAFDPSARGPRAAVVTRSATARDVLDPGTDDFSFGATVQLDAANEQAGSSDNGNNVLQRGLFGARSQYKIQIDERRPSCRVKGPLGAVLVTSKTTVTPGRWYGLACSRSGDTITLTVTRWTADGTPRIDVATATRPTGDLRPTVASLPLSVGAKVEDNGALTTSPDQFNGVIDDPFVRIGDSVVGVALPTATPADPPPATPPPPEAPAPPAPAPARIATTTHLTVNKPAARKKALVRLKGTVSPVGATHGATVRLRVVKHRKDGTKRIVVRETDKLSATGRFRFRDVRVRARTNYKVVFPRQGILLASKDKLVYRKGQFHAR